MAFLSFPYGWRWGRSRDAPPPPPESGQTYGRTFAHPYADVITKFSRLDGLPIFLTHGASLARFARWSSAIILSMAPLRTTFPYIPLQDYISLAAFLLVALENNQHVEITLCPKLKKESSEGFRVTSQFWKEEVSEWYTVSCICELGSSHRWPSSIFCGQSAKNISFLYVTILSYDHFYQIP